ncbi:MAG: glutamate racemase [Rhodocyclaceae bacterium]|nr:glutamate racemase [Rhodocyclaceae bacterium]MBX3669079.1 glutamate racemase [Rhodocyclaceae bacterium]
MSALAPIGVFDSGLGGLSVLRHIRSLLPGEHLLYCADSGHAPYGERSPEFIRARSLALAEFLLEQGARAIVIACNTATAQAATLLRERYALPIVAMEPAVKPAVAATRRGIIGVLATTGTLQSARFAALLDNHAGEVEVLTEACSGWVDCVERGQLGGPAVRALVARHVEPLLAGGADVLVLGCTHYPFLRSHIEAVAGPGVPVIDTGQAVARQLLRRLAEAGGAAPPDFPGGETFWSSAVSDTARQALAALWHESAAVRDLPI